ncbi:hypothetical protein [Streptomyces sp. Ag109_O5-10]|uniref:hypothetical protein n=1 Tax=Streptomyces sp. Ag109_O5-10 TaxID=1855349 RepID=UPI0015A5D50A|nr:hypothetical protein [Streptomyces sp. Ag109_O5-10]
MRSWRSAASAASAAHDDRQQFLDGIDLVLAGITATHHHRQEHPDGPDPARGPE